MTGDGDRGRPISAPGGDPGSVPQLVGRAFEINRIEAALAAAGSGRSHALVLRGEAGIGKSALLQEAARRASGMTLLTARGIQPEADVPFSGLHEALRPILHLLDRLPVRQANALRSSFALSDPGPADRFGVGAATLTILAAAADTAPLALLVDDAHVIDAASLDALVFAVRRLEDDPIATFFAALDSTVPVLDAAGFETVTLEGLGLADTAELVGADNAAHAHRATGGNPLALSLYRPRDEDAPIPVPERIAAAFSERTTSLAPEVNHLLLIVAAAGVAHVDVLGQTLEAVGIDVAVLESVEARGLAEIHDGRVYFTHPLVRAAVYQRADPVARRSAHRALAQTYGLQGDSMRRARHLGLSTLLPDEDVAAELEAAGLSLRERGLSDAALAALRRSVELTPATEDSSRRALAAADAAWIAGHLDDARQLLRLVPTTQARSVLNADVAMLSARIGHVAGEGTDAYAMLLESVEQLGSLDHRRAAHMLALAAELARPEPGGNTRALEAARRAASQPGAEEEPVVLKALGDALLDAGEVTEGTDMLDRAAAGYVRLARADHDPTSMQAAAYCFERIDRFADAHDAALTAVQQARDQGAVGLLPSVLGLAGVEAVRLGHWDDADAHFAEAASLALQLGQLAEWGFILACQAELSAMRGQAGEAADTAKLATQHAHRSAWTADAVAMVDRTLALATGDVTGLGSILEELSERDWDCASPDDLDFVEIAIRSGQETLAARVLEKMAAQPLLPLTAARLARCQGLVAEDNMRFDEARTAFTALQLPLEIARTLLASGEARRRRGERRSARAALERPCLFDSLGATLWAERAARELRLAGQQAHRRRARGADELAPQEEQITRLVVEGRTNREVGSILFISTKTVEAHLSRIFRKVGVTSRMELARRRTGNG